MVSIVCHFTVSWSLLVSDRYQLSTTQHVHSEARPAECLVISICTARQHGSNNTWYGTGDNGCTLYIMVSEHACVLFLLPHVHVTMTAMSIATVSASVLPISA